MHKFLNGLDMLSMAHALLSEKKTHDIYRRYLFHCKYIKYPACKYPAEMTYIY